MSLLNEIVEVKITRERINLDVIGLDTLLIMGNTLKALDEEKKAAYRVKSYGSLAELAAEKANDVDFSYGVNSEEYKAAKMYFGQNPKPKTLLVGQVFTGEEIDTAYNGILLTSGNKFYAVVAAIAVDETYTEEKIVTFAETVTAEEKIFVHSSKDPKTLVANENSIIKKLFAKASERIVTVYNSSTDYVSAGILGRMLTQAPGSATWAHKNISGALADSLTTTQRGRLENDLKSNFYHTLSGDSVFLTGQSTNGEFVDVIIGTDWIRIELRKRVAAALVSNAKIPYTNDGIGIFENLLRSVLTEAANMGILDADSIEISVPNALDIPVETRAQRLLPDVKFVARLAGAVHKVVIEGVLEI
jgi:hypothetical protein